VEIRAAEGTITPPGGAHLVRAAVGGDPEAFRQLVEPQLATALRATTVLIGSDADAADVVQDALLAAWRTLHALKNPDAFAAWFRQIVVRGAIRRARTRRAVVELDLSQRSGAGSLDRSVERADLARGFAALSLPDRSVLTLRYLWDVSTVEAAAILEIPEGTVKSRTHAAIERLRAAFEAEERR
jgi:RNA polymerase sigma-70 factor (ECF subfamily)